MTPSARALIGLPSVRKKSGGPLYHYLNLSPHGHTRRQLQVVRLARQPLGVKNIKYNAHAPIEFRNIIVLELVSSLPIPSCTEGNVIIVGHSTVTAGVLGGA